MELPAPAAEHPPRRLQRRDARRRGAVRPGLPHPPPAPARARASRPAAGGAADRRDRPRRRRLRGVPARAARGGQRDDPGDRHDPGHASADHRADLQPDTRPARRRQAPLPLPPDRVPDPAARGRDRAPPRQGLVGDAGGTGRKRRLAHARQRRAEAAGHRRVDRLAGRSEPARRRAPGRRGRRPHARVGAEVQRGPGGDPRGRPRAARAAASDWSAFRGRDDRPRPPAARGSVEPAPARRRRAGHPGAIGRLRAGAHARPADLAPAAVLDRPRRVRVRSGAGQGLRRGVLLGLRQRSGGRGLRPRGRTDRRLAAGRPAAVRPRGVSPGGSTAQDSRERLVVTARRARRGRGSSRGRGAAGDWRATRSCSDARASTRSSRTSSRSCTG